MRANTNHFEVLGLRPGRYAPEEIVTQFQISREQAIRANEQRPSPTTRAQLDAVHRAFHALIDPAAQKEELAALEKPDDRHEHLRRFIECSLEGNMIRYSRRQRIIAEAVEHGFSPFHAQLMIAQVQFGDRQLMQLRKPREQTRTTSAVRQITTRFAAAAVLALAMFLAMVRWLGT